MAEIGWLERGRARVRGIVDGFRDRHARRARDLAARLDALVGEGAGAGVGARVGAGVGVGAGRGTGDDDEARPTLELRPWDLRLPRPVILAMARARGLEPVGGPGALVERGPWRETMRFTRAAQRGHAAQQGHAAPAGRPGEWAR